MFPELDLHLTLMLNQLEFCMLILDVSVLKHFQMIVLRYIANLF